MGCPPTPPLSYPRLSDKYHRVSLSSIYFVCARWTLVLTACNALLDPLFMFSSLPVLENLAIPVRGLGLGVAGAALATSTAQYVAVIGVLGDLKKRGIYFLNMMSYLLPLDPVSPRLHHLLLMPDSKNTSQ